MPLASIWRRLSARRHKRRSFYETQAVMQRAVAEEAARRKAASGKAPDQPDDDREEPHRS